MFLSQVPPQILSDLSSYIRTQNLIGSGVQVKTHNC